MYLKQFGYITDSNHKKISVLDFERGRIDNKFVKSYSKTDNFYDLPLRTEENARLLEALNRDIENDYNRVVEELEMQGSLSELMLGNLIQIIANFYCRTIAFKELLSALLTSDKADHLLSEVTHFLGNKESGNQMIEIIKKLDVKHQINPVMAITMDYILNRLSHFRPVFLSDFANRGWITSDNPVAMYNNMEAQTFMGWETEIVFPISKSYCCFMYHPKAEKSKNVLRTYPLNKVSEITERVQSELYARISWNRHKHIIHPIKLSSTDLQNE